MVGCTHFGNIHFGMEAKAFGVEAKVLRGRTWMACAILPPGISSGEEANVFSVVLTELPFPAVSVEHCGCHLASGQLGVQGEWESGSGQL